MEGLQEVIEFLLQFRDTSVDWVAVLIAEIIVLLVSAGLEMWEIKHDKPFIISKFAVRTVIAMIAVFIVMWIFGKKTGILSVPVGILASYFFYEKYFKFMSETSTGTDIKHMSELNELKRKFKDNPYFSILEVLLFYGYISSSQKEYVETEGLFDSPEEMATKLLSMAVLTPAQLDEAKAIMNIIRREGQILTKQEALLLVSKMKERRDHIDDSNTKPIE